MMQHVVVDRYHERWENFGTSACNDLMPPFDLPGGIIPPENAGEKEASAIGTRDRTGSILGGFARENSDFGTGACDDL